jgi:membrane fusion protein, multidrug efflux system
MKKGFTIVLIISLFTLVACGGGGKKEKNAAITEKKAELAKLKKEKDDINKKIRSLESSIEQLDSSVAEANNAKLVRVIPITPDDKISSINLQGKIDADNISYISPRGMGGQVKQIFVKKGDYVKIGTPVLRLDDAIVRQNIIAAKKGLETIKVQQTLAKTLYERQKNLWEQNIGAEIQVIQAKTNVDALQTQLNAAQEGVKTAEEQMKTSMVYSDVTGYIDDMNIRVGELFAGATAFGPQIKVINTSSLKATVVVPENYISKVGRGSRATVYIPDLKRTIQGTISFTSMSVDANLRGFIAEVRIPYDAQLKPNQLAEIRIVEQEIPNAKTIPINIVQTDEKGKYVYVTTQSSNGKIYAARKTILLGTFFGDLVEVKQGLELTDKIIIEGYQNVYEGQLLKLAN